MTGPDGPRRLRDRLDAAEGALRRRGPAPRPAGDAVVVQVYNAGSMPAGPPGVYACRQVTSLGSSGPEVEAGAFAPAAEASGTVMVTVLGPGPVSPGDLLVAHRVSGRWVGVKYSGGGGGGFGIGDCPCTNIPPTLYLHVGTTVTAPEILVFPATLTRQTRPGDLAAYATDPVGYYSTTAFTSSDGYYTYRFWLGCSQGLYFLQGLYVPASPLGYPGRFQVMTWLIGVSGNSCAPFSLRGGSTRNLTFQAQHITIDGTGPP